jgi:broad specificity phosphatase PhoE
MRLVAAAQSGNRGTGGSGGRQVMFAKFAIATGMLMAALAASPVAGADTVYVIRHFQKEQGEDPALTVQGKANADLLADILADKGVTAVFATPTRRARETAEPLANRLGLSVTTYDPADVAALVRTVKAQNGAVLIVGHSNTVPDLVGAFGGTNPAAIDESSYGTLYVVRDGNSIVEQIAIATPSAQR